MGILIVLVACILSAILYRMGGSDIYDTKWRDIGCSLVFLTMISLIYGVNITMWYLYFIAFGLSWGALSTYWDWLFGYDNFYMHGLGCGLAMLPLIWCGIPWWVIVARIVICTLGMGWWSAKEDNAVKEELGRGVFYIL